MVTSVSVITLNVVFWCRSPSASRLGLLSIQRYSTAYSRFKHWLFQLLFAFLTPEHVWPSTADLFYQKTKTASRISCSLDLFLSFIFLLVRVKHRRSAFFFKIHSQSRLALTTPPWSKLLTYISFLENSFSRPTFSFWIFRSDRERKKRKSFLIG